MGPRATTGARRSSTTPGPVTLVTPCRSLNLSVAHLQNGSPDIPLHGLYGVLQLMGI